jgi:xylitol oxidase
MEPAAFQPTYPRLDDFRALATRLDPSGKFRNDFVDKYVL